MMTMAVLEHLSSKSKDLTQKAKDVTAQTKIKNLMKSEEEKIQSLYTTLGKLYYENETENIREPYADIIRTIHLSFDKKAEYETKLNEIKNKYVCPNCGASVTSTTQFCKHCGTKITTFTQ